MNEQSRIELKELIFFCIERLLMTKSHLDGVKNYISRRTNNDHQTIAFYWCLKSIFKSVIYHSSKCKKPINDDTRDTAFKKLYALFSAIRDFQEQFKILPKEDAPKELHRFLRNFGEQVPNNLEKGEREGRDKIEHVLYLYEQNSSTIFESNPLKEFENDKLSDLTQTIQDIQTPKTEISKTRYFHMLIPRIESKCPLYWPTLAHEFAHQVMELSFFRATSDSILEDWVAFWGKSISESGPFRTSFKTLLKAINQPDDTTVLASWLTECWCDCYAYFAIGPSFIFAQRNTFFFNQEIHDSELIGNKEHPPNFIRLYLLFMLSQKHQVDLMRNCASLTHLITNVIKLTARF